jgi:pimeloyl-ACP methyl ester carboxylesterase
MPNVSSNGIEIAYEEYGKADDPVLLMVQGLGMPLAAWPGVLIEALVAERFRVVTFDNRDIGQSQLLRDMKVPNVLVQTLRRKLGMTVKSPYQLTDMMRDVAGLMDALSIESAHVVGVSMGGMISQLLAIHEQQRVRSLTSIMSTTGNRKLPGPSKAVTRHIMRGPKASTNEARLAYHWRLWRLIGSPAYPLPDEELTAFLQGIFERGMTAAGTARQTLAILATPNRIPELKQLDVPTLVIHGDADPLIPVAGGFDTATAIPGARITTISGMGHDLPEALVPRLTRLIAQHANAAEPAVGDHKIA